MRGVEHVIVNLGREVSRTKIALAAYAQMQLAPRLETQARSKVHAQKRWHDITSQAKEGLHAGAVIRGNKIIVYVAHSKDYGVYLELSNDQVYAVLDPTVQANKDQALEEYGRILKT